MRLLLVTMPIVLLLASACSKSATKVEPTPASAIGGVAIDVNSLSPEARRAAEIALAPGNGYTAELEGISLESYRSLMCGRQSFPVEDVPVWAVVLGIISRLPMSGGQNGPNPAPRWPPANTMLWIIDASNYTSLQTFSPWPIDRAPGSNCP